MKGQQDEDANERVMALAREVYGDNIDAFLSTPRRSLHWETPAALVQRGEYDRVIEVLVRSLNGEFG